MGRKKRMRPPDFLEEPQNERMSMMENAIRVVETFFHRQRGGILEPGDAPGHERELTADENMCYRAALNFLKKEFGIGHRDGVGGVSDDDMPDDPTKRSPVREPK
jgi:hypothetical protein